MNSSRRDFLYSIGMLAAGATIVSPLKGFGATKKLKVVLVGTGVRGISFWGKRLVEQYPDKLEFVGLSDINPGRLKYAKEFMGVSCNTYTDFDKMLKDTKPDLIIVCTKDANHHEFIVKGLDFGADVLTEKPLTIDEDKTKLIIAAEKRSKRNLIVGFNYRWSPYMTKIKELLHNNAIGKVTSVDFNWYLNNHHGASYFRRWHGQMDGGGSLWVHKATHHFDLLNWWLNDTPEEVFAYGSLDHYGKNGKFRGENCRTCNHKNDCKYYWDITKDKHSMKVYVENEKYDGYIRDNCLFREEIDIYDKMSAQIKYESGVVANYSLTTYSPFEGWRIAFNGTEGRIEAWLDIPYVNNDSIDQEKRHALEMSQGLDKDSLIEPLILHKNWENFETINVISEKAGHGGGDRRLHDKIFANPNAPDPLNHSAGLRDGVMSILVGIGARRSIESGKPIKLKNLVTM